MEIAISNQTVMTEGSAESSIAKYQLSYTVTNGELSVLTAYIFPVVDGEAVAQMAGRIGYNGGIVDSSGMTSLEVLPEYFTEFNTLLAGLKESLEAAVEIN